MPDKRLENIVWNLLAFFPMMSKKLLQSVNPLGDTDLVPPHLHILVTLSEEGPLPTTEIGKRLHILKSNLTPLINKLIDKGLVERQPSETDRRYIYISITQKGDTFMKERKRMLRESLDNMLSTLPDSDLDELEHALTSVNRIMSKVDFK